MRRVSVLIPTFRRPDGVLRAARSVFAQRFDSALDVVALDNAPEHSARAALEQLAREAPCEFSYGHEPRPGVSHARNAALKLARGDLIAWLDDDEEAPPHWLAALLVQRDASEADVVFGPVRGSAPETIHRAYFERLYSRTGPEQSGPIEHPFGIGNSLMTRAALGDAPFDPRANETGGEDDLLFARMKRDGARFAWAADAWVTEHIDAQRLRVRHALKRAFAYGQGPCETAYAARKFGDLARHMAIGAAQAGAYGIAAGAAHIAHNDNALPFADLAMRGLGKVLWFRPQKFYGAA